MCGIFGWVTPAPTAAAQAWPARASTLLEHRGPDGEGVWRGELADGTQLLFGQRLLAIIGIGEGQQPFWSHDRRLVVTYNGEIYNYVELREELAAKGHTFRTACDTEVLLEAYRAWGPDCVARLRGMFAFALADLDAQRVVFARDAFGKKPLMLADLPGGGFAFASEVAPLLAHPDVRRTLNKDALQDYLVLRYARGPDTFFKGLRKLPPGSLLVWENGRASERRWYTPPFATTAPERMDAGEADAAFARTLDDAVRLRMRSDAPFGAFLSGGLDSSVITALMQRHSATPISTFSVGFDDPKLSELGHARRVAEHIGAAHHEVTITPQSFMDAWPDAVRLRGAPPSEASDIPILVLSRMARQAVKMVLTGEGADELLAGYPKYGAEAYVRAYHRLLRPSLHARLIDPVLQALPVRLDRVKILSRALGEGDIGRRGELWFGSFSPIEAARLLNAASARPAPARPPMPMADSRALQLFDQLAWLPDNLLERGDRMMMGGSVEGRMPFMDTELAALVARMPDALLTGDRGGKAILRRMAKTLVAPEVIARPKIGFTVPVADWLRTSLRPVLEDLLRSGESQTRRLLRAPELDRIIDQHLSGRFSHAKTLWALTNLEMFLREHRPEL